MTEVSCRGTLLYAYYDANVFFSKFCHSYNFGETWSQNLMLSELIEIRYRGILLYANYGFDV